MIVKFNYRYESTGVYIHAIYYQNRILIYISRNEGEFFSFNVKIYMIWKPLLLPKAVS